MGARTALPPSPKGDFIIGHTRAFAANPLEFMWDAVKSHGDIVLFQVLHKKVYMLNHPDYAKHVLQEHNKKYIKSPGYKPLRLLVGNGTFTSEGAFWLRQRRMYQPAFNNKSIEIYANSVIDCSNIQVAEWADKAEVNICRDMMKLTMEVIGRTLFSTSLSKDASYVWEPLSIALEYINHRALSSPFVWPANFPVPSNLKFKKAVAQLDKIIYGVIDNRVKNDDPIAIGWPDDLLSTFLNFKDEETGEKMTMEQIRDECMTIFLAGHESSANVLSWAFYELARNTDVQQKVYEEIESTVGQRELQYNDLHGLTYLVQVLNETMRLYPPIWHLGRQNIVEDEIGGYHIPKYTHIRISPFMLQRHPDFWEKPNEFDPDRFSREKAAAQAPFSFIPFGMGPRLCVGRNFAMMEMSLVMAQILQRYKLSVKSDLKVELGPLLTLRPKKDIILGLELR